VNQRSDYGAQELVQPPPVQEFWQFAPASQWKVQFPPVHEFWHNDPLLH
jgi:hypothetical protein